MRYLLLNSVFILVSCLAAHVLPLELLLLSYAILGPAHYLTEISWLNQKNFYIQGPRLPTVFLLVAGVVGAALREDLMPHFIWGSLLLAAISVCNSKTKAILVATVGLPVFLWFAFSQPSVTFLLSAVFLITVVHVCFFMLVFIVSGYLLKKEKYSLEVVGLYALAGASFFFFEPAAISLNQAVLHQLRPIVSPISQFLGVIQGTPTQLALLKFLSFAYTFHYLNWFSKTGLFAIRCLSFREKILTGIAYFCGVTLYLIDYRAGLVGLFFLSLLHVVLEFPLNLLSLKSLVWRGKQGAESS